MRAGKPMTNLTVKLNSRVFTSFMDHLMDMPLMRDAFIERMICAELPHLEKDLAGKRNTDAARRYIAGCLKKMPPRDQELQKVTIKLTKVTASALQAAVHRHNLCRDAFMNWLLALVDGNSKFLRSLGFSTEVSGVTRWSNTADMPTSPLAAVGLSLSDPLYYMRAECRRWAVGLYVIPLPKRLHGFACHLDDGDVPGTKAYEEKKSCPF